MGGMRSRRESGAVGLLEIAAVFARLGCLSFGGPVAHLGYFRAELVERRRWVDEVQYAELVALCQFLPTAWPARRRCAAAGQWLLVR